MQKFLDDNDEYRDPVVKRPPNCDGPKNNCATWKHAGSDRQKFRESMGRDVADQDIFNMHLEFKANGVPGIRSDDELLDATVGYLEDNFGIKRHIANIDRNRKRGVDDRMRVVRRLVA